MSLRTRGLWASFAAATLITVALAPHLTRAAGETRSISLYNIHTKEQATVVYKRDGRFVPEGLEKASWLLRDWRRNEPTKMDPELIDLLWEIHSELGSREPIHIISGFRSRATNDMLRRTVGGQASESQHIHGKAADVHFPDIPLKKLRYSALIRERGGVGYYPTSAIPFVHVDTSRVRHWPRLPRYELALLFPSGKSHHLPADGGPITAEDVRVAQSKFRDLAIQVAAFHGERRKPGAILVADAKPPAPIVTRSPVADRVAMLTPPPKRVEPVQPAGILPLSPSAEDRARLADLAALAAAPRLVIGPTPATRRRDDSGQPSLTGAVSPAGILPPAPAPAPRVAAASPLADTMTDAPRAPWSGWVPAPAYDEEHPEELSYRPFPIAPLLTTSASINDPLLARLVHHDAVRTLDLLDQNSMQLPLRLRPGSHAAAILWSQSFTGDAVGLDKLLAAQLLDGPGPGPGVLARPAGTGR